MRRSRSRPQEPGRRRGVPLLLSWVAGASTSAVAVSYLGSAWADVRDCGKSAPGAGCAAHPFWGFSPELFLTACLLGVVVGVLLAILGTLAHLRRVGTRLAGLLMIVLGSIGVLAYGGFGVGVVSGVVAGLLFAFPGRTVPASPAEWSGSLPPGVPPAPRPSGRAVPDRPTLTEWHGALAAARPGPPGAGRERATLPTADRLADALRRSRVSATPTGAETSLPPVIVLPPPPKGLRATGGATGAAGPAPDWPGPASAGSDLRRYVPAGEAEAGTRMEPIRPGSAGVGREAPPLPAPARGAPIAVTSGVANGPLSASRPEPDDKTRRETEGGIGRGPLHEFRPLRLGSRSETTPVHAMNPGPPSPARASPGERPPGPAVSAGGTNRSLTGHAAPRTPPPPQVLPPPPEIRPAPSPAQPHPPEPPLAGVTGPSRPPQPTTPAAKPRTKAWRCPKCRRVNAPWSPRCTRCKTDAPLEA
jgi:hypothetical protein